ncbi:MAG TPA: cellulose binding domain-containing protein [Pseudonocardiaceae bacterium]|nr:cellulose binding domain-containing protein [Pseudonocardiaceae bacterium]
MRILRRILTCLSAGLLGAGLVGGIASAAPAAVPLPTATFAVSSDWGTGYGAAYTIANPMTIPLSSWTVSFTLPAGDKVTSVWDGQLATNGNTYTVTNASYNAPVAAGTSVSFGFNVSYSGSSPTPGSCTLNGDPCDGSADVVAPTSPTNLAVLSTNGTSVTLNWTASTDNIEVAGYNIYDGSGTKVGSSAGPVGTVSGLSPSTSYSYSVRAFDEAGNLSGSSNTVTATTTAGGNPNHLPGIAAPFIDLGAWPTPSLTTIAENTGLRAFSLGFITNGSTNCTASWFNAYSMSAGFELSDINSLRSIGGDVKPSFGGEAGTELAQACTDVTSLTAAYQSVINEYNLTQIDFDIEGAAVADHASIDRRSAAMAALESAATAAGKSLSITLTLPVLPSGLDANGQYVVQSAVSHNVTISTVNVMAMDYGDSEAPNPAGKMGTYAIDAAQSTEQQLAGWYPGKSAAQLWNMVGVTPMLGVNDQSDEVFTQSDETQLLNFAQTQHLGELGFWDVTRDGNACTGSLSQCTNISQTPYQFSKMIAPYQG